MGTWNFGESEVTEGVKIVDVDLLEHSKELLENIEIHYTRKLDDDLYINIYLDTLTAVEKIGHYDSVALDYSLENTIVNMFLTDKENNTINVRDDDEFEQLEAKLEDIQGWYYQDLPLAIYNDYGDLEVSLEELEEQDAGAILFMLVQHSNNVLPTSTTVGWATGTYITDVATIEEYRLAEGEDITASCRIKTKRGNYGKY